MCAPAAVLIPLIGLGVQGGATAVGFAQQHGQAKAEQAAQARFVAATHAEATESTRRALQDLDARSLEEMLSVANSNENISRQGEQIRSTAVVAAGESGVTGQSVDELLNDVKAQTGRAQGINRSNFNITQAQIQRQREQVIAGGKAQYNSVQPTRINTPSVIAPLAQIASASLSAVDSIANYRQSLKIPIKTA